MYAINLLGPPQLLWCGQPLPIDRRQQRLLLTVIAASAQPVARRFLTNLFWPEVPDCRASRLLTRQMSALRSSLPQPGLLIFSSDHVALNRELADVDLWAIDACCLPRVRTQHGRGTLLDRASRDIGNHAPPQEAAQGPAIAAIEHAVARYRGPLLAGVDFRAYPELHSWRLGQQPLWEEKVLTLLADLVHHFATQNEPNSAIAYARRLLQIDPTHEESHRALIELYSTTGQRTAALRQYEACMDALAAISLQPSPVTDRTFETACEVLMV